MEWDVVVVGGINADYFVRGPQLPRPGMSLDGDVFLESPGGKGANAAVAAARLGARTALIGRVGHDARGRTLVHRLTSEGVHTNHVGVDDRAQTGSAVIQVDHSGQKQILAALGANLHLSVADVEAAAGTIRTSRVLLAQLEVPVDCVRAAARLAKTAGALFVLDPAPPRTLPDDLLPLVDVLRANATEIEALTGVHVDGRASARDAARALLDCGVDAVIVALAGGNLLVRQSGEEWIPELPVSSVDATGAGDAFAAGVATALAEHSSLPNAARFASGAAALSTTSLGAQAALPRRHELQSFLDQATAP